MPTWFLAPIAGLKLPAQVKLYVQLQEEILLVIHGNAAEWYYSHIVPVWKWDRGQLLFNAKEIESASCEAENC